MTAPALVDSTPSVARAVDAALAGLAPESKRAYRRRMAAYLTWLRATGRTMTRETVTLYLEEPHNEKAEANTLPKVRQRTQSERTPLPQYELPGAQRASAVNQTVAALKRLAAEAAANGWLDADEAARIRTLPLRRSSGVRAGNWLTADQARRLLAVPDRTTATGRRDYALLALLIGCGLRRSELVSLTAQHLQQRDGRTVIVDLCGKGGRIRTLTLPEWVTDGLAAYTDGQNRREGPSGAPGAILDGGDVSGYPGSLKTPRNAENGLFALSTAGVWWIVRRYARLAGVGPLAPHDLRRTMAKLARQSGCPLETVQATLGHASVNTTMKYCNTGNGNAGDWIAL